MLFEVKERRSLLPYSGLVAGWQYVRVLVAPKGDADAAALAAGELALGSVLPEAWGGPTTRFAWDARLQSVQRAQQAGGGRDELVCAYASVDLRRANTATSTATYAEASTSRRTETGPHESTVTTVGVCLADTDTGVPARGGALDGSATVLCHQCSDVSIDRLAQHGRLIVVARWVQHRAKVDIT